MSCVLKVRNKSALFLSSAWSFQSTLFTTTVLNTDGNGSSLWSELSSISRPGAEGAAQHQAMGLYLATGIPRATHESDRRWLTVCIQLKECLLHHVPCPVLLPFSFLLLSVRNRSILLVVPVLQYAQGSENVWCRDTCALEKLGFYT